MAVLNQKKSRVSDEIPTASMADIAFLLLIFFLVTTGFPKDNGLEVPPHHSHGWDRGCEAGGIHLDSADAP